ncbi:hypothetical protein [Rhodococcus sp. (in: high G+C Gram-positive bacteria)]
MAASAHLTSATSSRRVREEPGLRRAVGAAAVVVPIDAMTAFCRRMWMYG